MNFFEDLIEELKEENLLEETVIETRKSKNEGRNLNFQNQKSETEENIKPAQIEEISAPELLIFNETAPQTEDEQTGAVSFEDEAEFDELPAEAVAIPDLSENDFQQTDFAIEFGRTLDQNEFYKKRATDEVTSLQMVEHVLSGVERDFLHITPQLYDDLEVKKALHNFLQFSQTINSPEQTQAEFLLLQETESWYSALSQKDKNISVANLRRYCETTRPALSPQALAALARFYRNAPFSESVRSKFDLVMTRFFASETGGGMRRLTLSRDKIIEKLNEFYAEWSSIPLYATEEDESNIVLAAMKFEDFMTEAESAENFEELIKNDFFNRLKVFKESTHENFFAPLVTAASVESNVRIGNRYLELLLQASKNSDAETLEEKHGRLHEQTISEAVCKTIKITGVFEGNLAADIVRETPVIAEVFQPATTPKVERQDLNTQPETPKYTKEKFPAKSNLFRVNKLLLAVTILTILASVGLYLYVEYFNPPPPPSENVKTVNLDNSSLKDYIQTAKLHGDMFYGVVSPNWDGLDTEKREELLRKIILIGGEKGFSRVTMINKEGRTVGYASPEKVEVYNP